MSRDAEGAGHDTLRELFSLPALFIYGGAAVIWIIFAVMRYGNNDVRVSVTVAWVAFVLFNRAEAAAIENPPEEQERVPYRMPPAVPPLVAVAFFVLGWLVYSS
ncbi:MAG TPA: hypothetical protein VFO60_05935 [Candidatus Dormibacteraeota bacterium]|nr:hypothetical protein [Candidatus Dormibacteraeota bacterium]